MKNHAGPEQIRGIAVEHHTQVVDRFEKYYRTMTDDRFSNAFTYGRHKIDVALDEELKRLPAGAAVLDVGCGTGEYIKRLRAQGFEISGVEPSPAMREVAVRSSAGATIVDGLASSLPFESGTFDFAFVIEVYRYLHREDVNRSFAELLRVLKPGGRFFLTMVNRWALDGFYVLQVARELLGGGSADTKHPHCEFFTPKELERALRQGGATDVRVFGRMLAPLRFAYKVPGLGRRLGASLDALDDLVHQTSLSTPFAGHLIAVGQRP